MDHVIKHSTAPSLRPEARNVTALAGDPRRLTLLRRLGAQVDRLRQDLRRSSSEALLLSAMEDARSLTPAERKRASDLRLETWRIQHDLLRLRREYAALEDNQEAAVHRDVHHRGGAGGPLPALSELVRDA